MPEQIIVTENGHTRIVPTGPVGPPGNPGSTGPQGIPGPAGVLGDTGYLPTAMYDSGRKGYHTPITVEPGGGGSQSSTGSSGYAIWWPCFVSREALITAHQYVRSNSATSLARYALWTFDSDTMEPGTFVEDLGTTSAEATGLVSSAESTDPLAGYFYLSIWTKSDGSALWNRFGSTDFGSRMFGTASFSSVYPIRAWRTTGAVDYSAAWPTTLPSLNQSNAMTHIDDPVPHWSGVAV